MPRVTSNGGGSNSGQQQQALSPTTQQSQTQQNATGSGGGGSGTAAVVTNVVGGSGGGNNSQTTNTNNGASNGSNSTIVTIKQESLGNVDNLVGSYVDSTTFLHSPSSQMVNPNLVQNNSGLSGIGAGENEITNFFFINFDLSRSIISSVLFMLLSQKEFFLIHLLFPLSVIAMIASTFFLV